MTVSIPPGAAIAATVTRASALGFVPVAIHFNLFATLVGLGRPSSADAVAKLVNTRITASSPDAAKLCSRLAEDTLYVMAGLGFVDAIDGGLFGPNAITKHMVNMPSAQHGALHFTTEALFAGAFLMQKLKDTNFEYPFKEADTPMQYAQRRLGEDALADLHTYAIMEQQGRMDSFNQFMVGKFHKFGKMPERVKAFGYDLDAAISSSSSSSSIDATVAVVDIGGGRGELLLEIEEAYPHLAPEKLIIQEFNAALDDRVDGLTLMKWNYKEKNSPQPVEGARVYTLQHILHNLPDLDALALLQKVARAMAPYSRLLILEFPKNMAYANMHATMICLYGGRERSSAEWKQMAALCELEVTFEAYPAQGEGLIEMKKMGV